MCRVLPDVDARSPACRRSGLVAARRDARPQSRVRLAVGLLLLAGYQLGVSLATSDGLELVSGLADDLGLVTTAPGDVLAALGEVIPWSLVALAGVSATLLILAAGNVVSRGPVTMRARPIA